MAYDCDSRGYILGRLMAVLSLNAVTRSGSGWGVPVLYSVLLTAGPINQTRDIVLLPDRERERQFQLRISSVFLHKMPRF